MYEFITVNSANLYIHVISGVARVIVLGRQVASGEGILEVCPPPLLHRFRLFEWSSTQLGGGVAPLNYTTACNHKIKKYHNLLYKLLINNIVKNFNVLSEINIIIIA